MICKDSLSRLNWISILIPVYNTQEEYLNECFDSILSQDDLGISFAIELVIINDCSDTKNTIILENILNNLSIKQSSFLKIKYFKMDNNMGICFCLNYGINECSNELIFRMDSDDIMVKSRIKKQFEFMINNPACVLLGTDIMSFRKVDGISNRIDEECSNHPSILNWDEYKIDKKHWILNHPTLCFRKKAVLFVGNYNLNIKEPFEDLDLELRILKKYGFICNLQEILLFYRYHPNQITFLNNNKSLENKVLKDILIEKIISDV